METTTISELSATSFAAIEGIILDTVKNRVRTRISNAFQTTYMLTEEEISLFSKFIQRHVTLADNLKRSAHPIASALNEFARQQAATINNGNFLNIGGNPGKEAGVHYCHLINDCRNEERLKPYMSRINVCIDGAEECNVPAPNGIAVAVDSLYDIPIENLPIIFEQHQIEVLHAWMFLPLELIDDDLLNHFHNPLYKLKIMANSFNKQKVSFNFHNDLSAGYEHNRINWTKYITTTLIEYTNFNIFIEIKRNYGPFCYLTFVRTNFADPCQRVLPFSDFYNHFVKLPNYIHLLNHDFNISYKNLPKIICPKSVAHQLYAYVARGPDSSFSYERGATYFHGITSKIVIGNQVLIQDLGLVGHEYDEVCFAIMALATISRLRRTKNFGKLIRNLDNDFDGSNFNASLRGELRKLFGNFKEWAAKKLNMQRIGDNFNHSNNYMMYDLQLFEDVYVNYKINCINNVTTCLTTGQIICQHARDVLCACGRYLCSCVQCKCFHPNINVTSSDDNNVYKIHRFRKIKPLIQTVNQSQHIPNVPLSQQQDHDDTTISSSSFISSNSSISGLLIYPGDEYHNANAHTNSEESSISTSSACGTSSEEEYNTTSFSEPPLSTTSTASNIRMSKVKHITNSILQRSTIIATFDDTTSMSSTTSSKISGNAIATCGSVLDTIVKSESHTNQTKELTRKNDTVNYANDGSTLISEEAAERIGAYLDKLPSMPIQQWLKSQTHNQDVTTVDVTGIDPNMSADDLLQNKTFRAEAMYVHKCMMDTAPRYHNYEFRDFEAFFLPQGKQIGRNQRFGIQYGINKFLKELNCDYSKELKLLLETAGFTVEPYVEEKFDFDAIINPQRSVNDVANARTSSLSSWSTIESLDVIAEPEHLKPKKSSFMPDEPNLSKNNAPLKQTPAKVNSNPTTKFGSVITSSSISQPSVDSSNSRDFIKVLLAIKEFDDRTVLEYITNYDTIEKNDSLYKKIIDYERVLLSGKNRGYAKFEWIVNKFIPTSYKLVALDLSSAPGNLHALPFKSIIACNWEGEGALLPKYNNKFKKVYKYSNLCDLKIRETYDVLLCDIGDEDHTFTAFDQVLRFTNCKCTIVKFYLEHYEVAKTFSRNFQSFTLIKPPFSLSVNREFYMVGFNRTSEKLPFDPIFDFQINSILKCIVGAQAMYLNNNVPISRVSPPSTTYVEFNIQNNTLANGRYLSSLLNCQDPNLQPLMLDIVNKFKNYDTIASVPVKLFNGPPGCGKSAEIRKIMNNKTDLVIVPTRELKAKYIKYGITSVRTQHAALMEKKQYSNIFVDEAFMFGKPYYSLLRISQPNAAFKLYGDTRQIGLVDFNNTYDRADIFDDLDYTVKESKRVPMDVASQLRNHPYKTSNCKLCSIVYDTLNNFMNKAYYKHAPIITFSQNTKARLNAAGYEASTIHEQQGTEYAHCVWYLDIDDKTYLQTQEQHITVALSRHYNSLVIVGELPGTTQLNYLNTTFERINENLGMQINDLDSYDDPLVDVHIIKKEEDDMFRDKYDKYDVQRVVEILNKVNNLSGVAANFRSVGVRKLCEAQQGKAHVNFDTMATNDIATTSNFLTPCNTARAYDSKDVFSSVKTLLGRYLLKTKTFTPNEIPTFVELMNNGINKFIRYDVNSTKFIEHFKASEEEWTMAFHDYIKVVQSKKLPEGTFDHEFDELELNTGINVIKYFMKKQDKNDNNWEHTLRDKLGQGVNAWNKVLNAVYSASARVFAKKFKTLLKSNVVIASGQSDRELGDEIAKFINNSKQNKKLNKHTMSGFDDLEQFDASQNEVNIAFEMQFTSAVNNNKYFLAKYKDFRETWVAAFNSFCKLFGRFKQQSGQPYTFDYNSLNCLAINGVLFEFTDFTVAAFKGDDFYICSDNLRISTVGRELMEEMGFKCKIGVEEISEFVGYIVTRNGFFPDLLRICQKLLNKAIDDEKYFDELKLAAYDRLQVISTYKQLVLGKMAYLHYQNKLFKEERRNIVLNDNDVDEMLGLLFNLKQIKFEQLIKMTKQSIMLNPVDNGKQVKTLEFF